MAAGRGTGHMQDTKDAEALTFTEEEARNGPEEHTLCHEFCNSPRHHAKCI